MLEQAMRSKTFTTVCKQWLQILMPLLEITYPNLNVVVIAMIA